MDPDTPHYGGRGPHPGGEIGEGSYYEVNIIWGIGFKV